MSTTTDEKWICPECNIEMVNIGRREMKVPMIGMVGVGECSFHPTQYKCPVCQAIAYNGAELIEQLRARQKTMVGMSIIENSNRAIEACNRLHARRNQFRCWWGVVLYLCGAISVASIFDPSLASWLILPISFIAGCRITYSPKFTTKQVWDEVPDQKRDESGVA